MHFRTGSSGAAESLITVERRGTKGQGDSLKGANLNRAEWAIHQKAGRKNTPTHTHTPPLAAQLKMELGEQKYLKEI